MRMTTKTLVWGVLIECVARLCVATDAEPQRGWQYYRDVYYEVGRGGLSGNGADNKELAARYATATNYWHNLSRDEIIDNTREWIKHADPADPSGDSQIIMWLCFDTLKRRPPDKGLATAVLNIIADQSEPPHFREAIVDWWGSMLRSKDYGSITEAPDLARQQTAKVLLEVLARESNSDLLRARAVLRLCDLIGARQWELTKALRDAGIWGTDKRGPMTDLAEFGQKEDSRLSKAHREEISLLCRQQEQLVHGAEILASKKDLAKGAESLLTPILRSAKSIAVSPALLHDIEVLEGRVAKRREEALQAEQEAATVHTNRPTQAH